MLSSKKDGPYTVYIHTNIINQKVYIGITKQTPERRWQNGHGYKETYFGNAIKKYGWDNFKHEILFTGLSKEDACEIEIMLIEKYNSNNKEKGYNICEGGQTGDNLVAHYGMDNNRAVSIRRIDPKTNEQVIYRTLTTAAREMGINYRGISKACRGDARTYKGYIWEYADGNFEKKKKYEIGKYPHEKQKKKIKMIDKQGVEYVFESINEAGEKLKMRPNTISRYVSGVRNDPKGRRWSYWL